MTACPSHASAVGTAHQYSQSKKCCLKKQRKLFSPRTEVLGMYFFCLAPSTDFLAAKYLGHNFPFYHFFHPPLQRMREHNKTLDCTRGVVVKFIALCFLS